MSSRVTFRTTGFNEHAPRCPLRDDRRPLAHRLSARDRTQLADSAGRPGWRAARPRQRARTVPANLPRWLADRCRWAAAPRVRSPVLLGRVAARQRGELSSSVEHPVERALRAARAGGTLRGWCTPAWLDVRRNRRERFLHRGLLAASGERRARVPQPGVGSGQQRRRLPHGAGWRHAQGARRRIPGHTDRP